jgi:enterochelin esterase family protein
MAGNANFVLDNLLAENKAVPMIVVMPFGNATSFGEPTPPGGITNDALFEDYLLTDVISTVEARYRVAPGRQNRAIAGLSMGGGQSLKIGLGHRICSARSRHSQEQYRRISRRGSRRC